MRKYLFFIFGILMGVGFLVTPQQANGEGTLAVMFEDAVEFNSRLNQESAFIKFHEITPPEGSVEFFNLFCQGNASDPGGTDNFTREVFNFTSQTPSKLSGELLADMTICEFCVCASLEGQAFDDCLTKNQSCATVNNAIFNINTIMDPEIMPDPDFPEAIRVLFTMTEHDPPINCTGKYEELCEDNKLQIDHHCIHLFQDGKIVKSVSSGYAISSIE